MNGLLFITHATERYDHLQSALLALEGGCRQIQLRMKEASPREVEQIARLLKEPCDRLGAALYIDDHVEVCRRVEATGVHLGKNDMPLAEARRLLGLEFVIGGTANTAEDVLRLAAAGADYIGLGPFRFTTTKKNLSPVLGLQGYREVTGRCREAGVRLPVLAIGGITPADIPALMTTGISGIALSSAILGAEDPVAETARMVEQMCRLGAEERVKN
ncbi:MAG: thiamine phosphate synthase [Culturomica sp.]|jgi:thiamine-phosphate pyrophosphorylase|nr:thiamine phosphate synthase [Culturomica sp.]